MLSDSTWRASWFCAQHQVDGLLDRHVLHEDGGLAVALDVLVEDEIDAGLARQHLEDHLGLRVAELQRHRAVVAGAQLRRRVHRATGRFDLAAQRRGRREARILGQDAADPRVGQINVALLEILGARPGPACGADPPRSPPAPLWRVSRRSRWPTPAGSRPWRRRDRPPCVPCRRPRSVCRWPRRDGS